MLGQWLWLSWQSGRFLSLPIPEVRGSDPVIGKNVIMNIFTVKFIEKTKLNVSSVTRLGKILPLWQNFKAFGQLLKALFTI